MEQGSSIQDSEPFRVVTETMVDGLIVIDSTDIREGRAHGGSCTIFRPPFGRPSDVLTPRFRNRPCSDLSVG